MIELNEIKTNDVLGIQRELAITLVSLSNGMLTISDAEAYSEQVMEKYDFNNSALTHKGVNWMAQEILSKIDFSRDE